MKFQSPWSPVKGPQEPSEQEGPQETQFELCPRKFNSNYEQLSGQRLQLSVPFVLPLDVLVPSTVPFRDGPHCHQTLQRTRNPPPSTYTRLRTSFIVKNLGLYLSWMV